MFEHTSRHSKISTERAASAARIARCARAEAAQARRLHRATRRPASGRICPGVRRAAGVADQLYRFGRAAIVLADRAVIFVDGRYLLQVRDQVDTNVLSVEHLVITRRKVAEKNLAAGARFAYDPWLHSVDQVERFSKGAASGRRDAVPVDSNPLDAVWTTALPATGPVTVRELKIRRRTSADKLARIRPEIAQLKADTLIVSDAHTSHWPSTSRSMSAHAAALASPHPARGRPSIYIDGRKPRPDTRLSRDARQLCASRARSTAI